MVSTRVAGVNGAGRFYHLRGPEGVDNLLLVAMIWNQDLAGPVLTLGSERSMIRITRQTDYGIVLLTHMAGDLERRFNAPELAEEVRLPLPTVSKILKLLTREGLLASH